MLSSQPSEVAVGTTILARYRVVGTCGAGGFGSVLICWDTRLQRRVAIKRIPALVSGPSANTVAAALAEARTASLLAHGNIVTVYDFESDADFAYLVMEYIDGLTLAELIQRVEGGHLLADEIAYIVSAVASALTYAHANGVLHLDIKPTNIMINAAGAVKLCDFGMASLASAAGYGGARGGTVGYMSPEQIDGDLVDERSDVFSFAVVVWQALTGANPFAASSADASRKLIYRKSRPKLSKSVLGISPEVNSVLLSALEPEASARTASIGEFAESLVSVLGDPSAGAHSVASLLQQATNDEIEASSYASELPVAFRYPWLGDIVVRIIAAITAGVTAYAPCVALLSEEAPWILPATLTALVAITMLWTPAGSLLSIFAFLAALATPSHDVASIMLPGVVGLAFAVWWVIICRRSQHATTALLMPVALHASSASPPIVSAFFSPPQAIITAVAAWLVFHLYTCAITAGFNASETVATFGNRIISLMGLCSLVGTVVATAVTAGITYRSTATSTRLVAQIIGAFILAASQLAAVSMENDGIVPAPSWSTVGVAVTLCIAMGIVTVFGFAADEEGIHELR